MTDNSERLIPITAKVAAERRSPTEEERKVMVEEAYQRAMMYSPPYVIEHRHEGCSRVIKHVTVEHRNTLLLADRMMHLLIKRHRPELDVRFVFENASQRISKQSKQTYGGWCAKHGIPYAEGNVPEIWHNARP